ncbi:uncharacterized protein LOC105628285 isoform X2 [Jatropha curcas]|uniref:uncharacterized protein LOC105628285 isoform X2 n=1 Tax=Jatropha curcas TaxID=180498 RepID=UPI001894ED1A|nr:uncharacterized protein LOC105628285 isoform X2 [Jatropha curcas]
MVGSKRYKKRMVMTDREQPLIRAAGEEKGKEDKMEIAVKTLFLGLNPKLINHKKTPGIIFPNLSCKSASVSHQTRYRNQGYCARLRENHRCFSPVFSVLSGAQDVGVSTSQFEDFSVMASSTDEAGELRINVEVSGAKTREIFDKVFDKMVAAAQPIPGFRRVKGDTKRHFVGNPWTFKSLQGSDQENDKLYCSRVC